MGRPRRFPDHPVWKEIDGLIAAGKKIPGDLRLQARQDPTKPMKTKRELLAESPKKKKGRERKEFLENLKKKDATKGKTEVRPVKKSHTRWDEQHRKEKAKRAKRKRKPVEPIVRKENGKPLKKVPKKCEHPANRLMLLSHVTKATTGDFKGWYRCVDCKEMIVLERKVPVGA